MDMIKIPMDLTEEECKEVIAALEKQEPKKPIVRSYDENEKWCRRKRYYCPVCKRQLSIKRSSDKYCGKCGQHIDWHEVNNGYQRSS